MFMYKKNLLIAGLISLALHTAAVMKPSVTSEPEVIFKKGESSLKMHLVPSVTSVASSKSMNDMQDTKKDEEKTVTNPKPLPEREHRKTEPVAVKKSLQDIQKRVSKAEEKTINNPKSLEKAEQQEENQKDEDSVEKTEEEITYSAQYFKTKKKEVDIKKSQIQERKAAALDSNEIIADVKVKGVTMGATINNVFKPFYPSSCKRQGHEGTTVLEVIILSKGKCGNIDIIQSAGCKSLDKAALKALRKAVFIPARRLGVPFTTTKKIAFNFKLEDYQ